MAWVNRELAKKSGGTFWVRIDDLTNLGTDRNEISYRRHYGNLMLDDLEWMGIPPDAVSWQSEWRDVIEMYREKAGIVEDLRVNSTVLKPTVLKPNVFGRGFGFVSNLDSCLNGVILDKVMRVNPVVRGDDLLVEQLAYAGFCSRLGFDVPKMAYLPRIEANGQSVSGTNGMLQIQALRKKGMTPEDILEAVISAGLVDPSGPISADNIAWDHPTLKGAIVE
jgi:glutamyl/glutaminyl-tRNA synthetase